MNKITIYADGSGHNSGDRTGGWAAILMTEAHRREIAGYAVDTTSIRMEMVAVIEALKRIKDFSLLHIYSDSEYVVLGMSEIPRYNKRQRKRVIGSHIPNDDLWVELETLALKHICHFHHVKGHDGNPLNELCDRLAGEARKRQKCYNCFYHLDEIKEPPTWT